jgi:acyl carrier protein
MTDIELWACKAIGVIDPSFSNLDEHQRLTENLFSSGRLDSLGLMNFLLDAEVAFDFSFTAEAFQDRRLQTIKGLAEVINELRCS